MDVNLLYNIFVVLINFYKLKGTHPMFKSASDINTKTQQIFDSVSAKRLEAYETLIAETIDAEVSRGAFELQVVFTNTSEFVESQPSALMIYEVHAHMQTYITEALDKKLKELGYYTKAETFYTATHITSYLKINWKELQK